MQQCAAVNTCVARLCSCVSCDHNAHTELHYMTVDTCVINQQYELQGAAEVQRLEAVV
jgi:hypothetical protein